MEKQIVLLGDTELGRGQPAVCIPVMGKCLDELAQGAAAAKAAGADVIELRADSMSAMPSAGEAMAMCRAVRGGAPGVPLLFTLRTERDGGAACADTAAYEALIAGMAEMGAAFADAVDVELSVGEAAFLRIAHAAHTAGVAVVGSSHDFSGTPAEDEICKRLERMESLGADICKIAVMPRSRLDVLTLMRAAVRCDEALRAPVIAIAMGRLGALTRLGAEAFGSCLTFGTAGQASAPGQLDAKTLRSALQIIHKSL